MITFFLCDQNNLPIASESGYEYQWFTSKVMQLKIQGKRLRLIHILDSYCKIAKNSKNNSKTT